MSKESTTFYFVIFLLVLVSAYAFFMNYKVKELSKQIDQIIYSYSASIVIEVDSSNYWRQLAISQSGHKPESLELIKRKLRSQVSEREIKCNKEDFLNRIDPELYSRICSAT